MAHPGGESAGGGAEGAVPVPLACTRDEGWWGRARGVKGRAACRHPWLARERGC